MAEDYLEIARRAVAKTPALISPALGGGGCGTHHVTPDDVATRWRTVEETVDAAALDDRNAQLTVIATCACCCGPCRVEVLVCTRCTGASLEGLREAPACALCGLTGDRRDDAGRWVCERCDSEKATAA